MRSRCNCCDTPGETVSTKSRLKKGVSFNLCGVCAAHDHEPRHWIILFGRTNGVRAVEKPAKKGLYCGKEILLRELL